MVSHPKTPILNCFYHFLSLYVLTVSDFSCLAKSYSVSGLPPLPHIPNHSISSKRVHMKCLRLIGRHESCLFTYKNFLLYPLVIESVYFYLLCLSEALLCYTAFQNSSLTRSTSCSCSTCCFGLSFQIQNLQLFTK